MQNVQDLSLMGIVPLARHMWFVRFLHGLDQLHGPGREAITTEEESSGHDHSQRAAGRRLPDG
ncbi:MAG: hypothetical protein ACLP9L_12145 [Thermoguttaceae bacterium]